LTLEALADVDAGYVIDHQAVQAWSASLRFLEDYENNKKIQRLQAMIAQGDADIEAGRVTEYISATDLANSIIR
jgi:predicted transcriptional regulator